VNSLTIGSVPRAALTSLFLKRKVSKPPHVLVLCDFFAPPLMDDAVSKELAGVFFLTLLSLIDLINAVVGD
jgi:hypothetical protein